MKRSAVFALAAALVAFAAPASAQVMYGGYNLGPDYGRMIQQQLQLQQQRNQQMQQMEQQVVQQAMQDPVCIQHYQQHQLQGGQMSPYQFAYECVRQGRFTAQGRANAFNADRQNQANETAALQRYRQAQQERGLAQQQYMHGYQRNNQEFGNYLQGRNTWINPQNGQAQVLQHTQPGVPQQDPRTGQVFVMDNLGQYHVRGQDGLWYRMQQQR